LAWLIRYWQRTCAGYRRARPDTVDALLKVFTEPIQLFSGAEKVGDRIAVLPVLFHLLWQQRLVTDLEAAPLGAATAVRCATGVAR
jgi:hypothetical protein